jgi:mono/diheme cytochrome c family protein
MRRMLIAAGVGSVGLLLVSVASTSTRSPTSASSTPNLPALKLTGNATRGKNVFIHVAGCGGCHTLKDAHAIETLGPNLDHVKPSFAVVVRFVSLGGTSKATGESMPAFSHVKGAAYASFVLTSQQIADVAKYVATVAGR